MMMVAACSAAASSSGSAFAQVMTMVRACSGAAAKTDEDQSRSRLRLTTATGGISDWPRLRRCAWASSLSRIGAYPSLRTVWAPIMTTSAICRIRRNRSRSGAVDRAPTRPWMAAVPSRPATMCPVTQHSCRSRVRSTSRYGANGSGIGPLRSSRSIRAVYSIAPTVIGAETSDAAGQTVTVLRRRQSVVRDLETCPDEGAQVVLRQLRARAHPLDAGLGDLLRRLRLQARTGEVERGVAAVGDRLRG